MKRKEFLKKLDIKTTATVSEISFTRFKNPIEPKDPNTHIAIRFKEDKMCITMCIGDKLYEYTDFKGKETDFVKVHQEDFVKLEFLNYLMSQINTILIS